MKTDLKSCLPRPLAGVYGTMLLCRFFLFAGLLLFPGIVRAQDRNIDVLHVFPIVVDGVLPDGTSYRTSLVMQNLSFATAACWIGFLGTTPPMVAPDGTVARGGLIQQVLPPGSFDVLRSAGAGTLTSGYMWVSCSFPISAYAIYSSYRAVSGGTPILISETTVYSTPPGTTLQFINDSREGGELALSLANDQLFPVLVRIFVFDLFGRQLASFQLVVAAKTSINRFLAELLPGLPARHVGPVRLETNGFIYATGLRFTGPVLTLVPPAIR